MKVVSLFASMGVALLLLAPDLARAEEPALVPGVVEEPALPPIPDFALRPASVPGARRIDPPFGWHEAWPRFRLVEYLATAALIAANVFGDKIVPPPTEVRWQGGILFDEILREEALKVDDDVRRHMTKAGDILYPAMSFLPIALDALILSLIVHGSLDVAWQTSMISLQSMLLSAILNLVVKRTTARARPNIGPCDPDNAEGVSCPRGGAIRSFYSGHAAAAATGAGLLCVQHEYLDLFGGGAADHITCAAGLGVALYVGVSRVVNDAHWASDTIAGWALGLAVGVLVPVALHYGTDPNDERRVWIAPAVADGGFGLTFGGMLD